MAEFIITLQHQNVHDILQKLTFSGTPFVLVETMASEQARPVLGNQTYVIFDLRDAARYNVDAYPVGRIFDATGELKWQKAGATFQLVYIGAEAQANALKVFQPEASEPRELFDLHERSVYLWGQKVAKERVQTEMQFEATEATENIFIELQIPQYLSYPVLDADNARVRMQTREYNDQHGNLEYYRFVTVTTVTSEK